MWRRWGGRTVRDGEGGMNYGSGRLRMAFECWDGWAFRMGMTMGVEYGSFMTRCLEGWEEWVWMVYDVFISVGIFPFL